MSTLNYFELLGLPEALELDRAALESAYQIQQSRWHPDQFASADAALRARAVQQTSLLNDAYRRLREPVLRAEHLLTLRGVDTERLEQHELEPAFLFEQMQWREELQEYLDAHDSAALEKLDAMARARFAATWRAFAEAFTRPALEAAKREFHKLQFLRKLQHDISDAEAHLDA
ncbi:MAG: Fe-S protein assembly co-chaperone HscB [Pseudomonadales bacterium]|jgi:molecular chaperone HscB|nr:Fe-S protein assembly co-chaperone HscB [Pseudomonadales bacterium]